MFDFLIRVRSREEEIRVSFAMTRNGNERINSDSGTILLSSEKSKCSE